ncbi:multidrug resistance protein B [Yersinia frederiksenii]|uniref:Multidrug resistance protein B n=2 Tax=Yersinia frederiksenii TaxID=29484 RepID=A0A380PQ29_YERFR|nr:MFS transporter [Yersinia frederiksenii]ATM95642.1 MFS transporter [Yersinia frederiksenii]EEQ15132.1 Major facilitator superfamily MFS_1 [Yersinia frederiksenii ATCC 33641]KGA44646.1 major Facilitator Superfamily protein [Yersinia frederiksenii ATCC 33641]SUP75725.1 multidrug resistance protein B [Yersinia frederiksenii]
MKDKNSHLTAVLLIVLVSYFMIIIDASIVITGLDKIQQELGFTEARLAWMQDAYLLTFGGFLLLGGRLGDIMGRRRILIIGLSIFTGASVMVGLAPSPLWAIAGRACQGLGSAIVAPTTLALLQINFPEGPERNKALAWYATTAGVSASIGLVVGGILADWTWRAGFFINLPVGMILIFCAARFLNETEKHKGEFDVAGAISSTLGMGAIVFGTVHSAEAGWHDTTTFYSMLFGLLCLALLIVAENHAKQPIIPLRLFKNSRRSAALAARFLYLGAIMGFWFFTSLYLQGVTGLSTTMTGIAFLPMTVFTFLSALTLSRLTLRFGNERLLVASILMSTLGMVWLAQASAHSNYLTSVALPMVIIGIAQGVTLPSLTVAAVAGASKEDAGALGGLVNAFQQLGGSMGLALLTTVSISSVSNKTSDSIERLAHRVSSALTGGALMLSVAFVFVVLALISSRRNARNFSHEKL